MSLSNTAVPIYYGKFRDAVIGKDLYKEIASTKLKETNNGYKEKERDF